MLEDCQVCKEGTYNSELGRPVCKEDCNAGSYILPDKSDCLKCPFGQWQNLDDQSSCIKCSKGRILKKPGQTSNICTQCVAGQYNPYRGNDGSCLPCDTAKEVGATECKGCDPGQYILAPSAGSQK